MAGEGGGYGAGLFDSKGPENFATKIGTISTALSAVQSAFSGFGQAAASSLEGISGAVDALISKLSQAGTQLQGMGGVSGGGGGGGGGVAAQAGQQGSGNVGAAGQILVRQGGQWVASNGGGPGGYSQGSSTAQGTNPMPLGTADAANATSQGAPQPTGIAAQAAVAAAAPASQVVSGVPQGSATMGVRAAQSMIPAAVGGLMSGVTGAISTAVQGQAIGQMAAPAFGVSARSLYVMPAGTLAQNQGQYAQANAYAMQNMGVGPGGAPGSTAAANWSTVQRGSNQLMTLLPGMQRPQAMAAQNQMMQPGNLNAGMMFGFNFSPGGKLADPQQQYQMVFDKLAAGVGGKPTGTQLEEWMRPGAPWANNIGKLGWTPGSDEYAGFMQFAQTRIGLQNQGKLQPGQAMPDLGTKAGAKQTPLGNTAAYAQLTTESKKSTLESQAEPALAQAAKSLNEAAGKLIDFANPLSKLFGSSGAGNIAGHIMNTVTNLNPISLAMKTIIGGKLPKFADGGIVTSPTLAMVGEAGPEKITPLHGGSGNGGVDSSGGLASLLTGKPPSGSILDLLLRPAPGGLAGGSAMAGLVSSSLPNANGGSGGGSTGSSTGFTWNSRSSGIGPVDMSSKFASKQTSSSTTSNGGGGSGASGSSTPASGAGGTGSKHDWAQLLLQDVGGVPVTENNVTNIGRWMTMEEPSSNWNNRNNPLNASLGTSASDGTASYPDLGTAAQYTAKMINQSNMSAIKAALAQNASASDFAAAVISSPWASSHYRNNQAGFAGTSPGFARGTQFVDRTQLALLHRGEAVIPAADNYTSGSAYNRNGASGGGGGGPTVHLNFKPGSVVLQVPPTSSQQDMDTLANQFVAAISKPAILAGVRSS